MTSDLSYWDQQFRFSQVLPDFQFHLDWMQQRAEAVAADLQLTPVAYGADERQWLEYGKRGQAAGQGLTVVFIHGGFWRAQTAQGHRACLPSLAQLGLGDYVANLEYRLMPQTRMAGMVADVAQGLHKAYELSGQRLLVLGHSAGAHLALEAWRQGGLDQQIAGVVGLSGIYELRPVQWSFLQAELHLTQQEIAAHSPLDSPFDGQRLLVVVGEKETPEFQRQGQMLAAVSQAGFLSVKGVHHMGILPALAGDQVLVPADNGLLAGIKQFAEGLKQ